MTQCRHCGQEFAAHLGRHEVACPMQPETLAELREFMHYWAEDGVAIPRGLYVDFAADYKLEHGRTLPGAPQIERAYGSWLAFANACGLAYTPRRYHPKGTTAGTEPCAMPGSVMSDDTMHHDPSCLRCVPATRPVRQWQPQAHTWVTVGEQLVWQVR